MLEKHVHDEIVRQVGCYADAMRVADECSRKMSALLMEIDSLKSERMDAERLCDIAEGNINGLIENIDDDEGRAEVMKIISDGMASAIVGGMVVM